MVIVDLLSGFLLEWMRICAKITPLAFATIIDSAYARCSS